MMAKHTSGPWAYHTWTDNGGKAFGIETADHRHGLAGIRPNGNASTLLTMEQHEANARLIAAAPDLLIALDEMVRCHSEGNQGFVSALDKGRALDAARDALEKAGVML